MAQSRSKRRQRTRRPAPSGPSQLAEQRSTRLRRIVIAFLVIVGLAGILAIASSDGDGDGAPAWPGSASDVAR
jgi:hypothetical protein